MIITSGKRKSAVARCVLKTGTGKVTINGKNHEGGGEKGQIDASRLALAKAFIEATKSEELRDKYLAYDRNLLVADVRRKEAYKPGDSKARSKRQSSKR
jgi:small subunit ribosomal protein S9